MYPIEAPRCASRATGFGAEAMANATKLEWQFFSVDHLAGIEATKGNFCRGNQIQILIFDTIDLGFRATRDKADTLENFPPSEVGSDGRDKTFADQKFHRILLECPSG